MIPGLGGPLLSYHDPTLWRRLAPKIREQDAEKRQHLVDGRWKTLEDAREMVGYLKALQWVLDTADELTRTEETSGQE